MANEKRLTLSTGETCGDCIHAKVCKEVNGSWFSPNNIAYCRLFKNKADFVEVVRCKDCKHYLLPQGFCNHDRHEYQTMAVPQEDNDFCSYGERKDNG